LNSINIISFDVPYPANYGGVIDVFYKIKAFYNEGIKVHLHCYEYGRGEQKELENYCETVTYYKRKTGTVSFLSKLPYIVKSRASKTLKENILKNDFPILFEGLHTCFLLSDDALKNRFKIVRNHNVEHHYYKNLAKAEKNDFRKRYFKTEAKRLKQFEPILKHANLCLAISESDLAYFKKTYPTIKNSYAPAFHPSSEVKINTQKGNYALYHGNLSVSENINAVKFLIKKVFNDLPVPLIIAGLNPSKEVKNLIENNPNVSLVANPTDEKLNELITNAQVNLLYTEQATGLKLKLLNVLFNGKHCLANNLILEGSSLKTCCTVANTEKEYKTELIKLMQQDFTLEQIEQRKKALTQYSNSANIKQIIENITF